HYVKHTLTGVHGIEDFLQAGEGVRLSGALRFALHHLPDQGLQSLAVFLGWIVNCNVHHGISLPPLGGESTFSDVKFCDEYDVCSGFTVCPDPMTWGPSGRPLGHIDIPIHLYYNTL